MKIKTSLKSGFACKRAMLFLLCDFFIVLLQVVVLREAAMFVLILTDHVFL